jgi:hypothetical protein
LSQSLLEAAEQQGPCCGSSCSCSVSPAGLVGGFDDEPLVVGAAQRLALDDFAGDAEAAHCGDWFLKASAADA